MKRRSGRRWRSSRAPRLIDHADIRLNPLCFTDPDRSCSILAAARLAGCARKRNPMALPRRQFLHLVGIAAALPALSRLAWAQGYPTRPVHWIVSFTAGGPNDTVARIIRRYMPA